MAAGLTKAAHWQARISGPILRSSGCSRRQMVQLAAARYRADDNQKSRRLRRKNADQSSIEIDDVRRSTEGSQK
jgi:hypothetical protein